MSTFCGMEWCNECEKREQCGGCEACHGHPCGGNCVAERFAREGGQEEIQRQKESVIADINALGLDELHLTEIHFLGGWIGNIEYSLFGKRLQLLNDHDIYFGTQVERSNGRCYGVVADSSHIVVCEYGEGGVDPELLLLTKRGLKSGI